MQAVARHGPALREAGSRPGPSALPSSQARMPPSVVLSESQTPPQRAAPDPSSPRSQLALRHLRPPARQIRTVQCLKCGKVGHSSGDKECPQYGQASSATEATRLRLEDPLTLMKARHSGGAMGGDADRGDELGCRGSKRLLSDGMHPTACGREQAREALMTHERFEMKRPMTGRSPTRGAGPARRGRAGERRAARKGSRWTAFADDDNPPRRRLRGERGEPAAPRRGRRVV